MVAVQPNGFLLRPALLASPLLLPPRLASLALPCGRVASVCALGFGLLVKVILGLAFVLTVNLPEFSLQGGATGISMLPCWLKPLGQLATS